MSIVIYNIAYIFILVTTNMFILILCVFMHISMCKCAHVNTCIVHICVLYIGMLCIRVCVYSFILYIYVHELHTCICACIYCV